jgi:DNA-binding NarL/FixJ family response regulator
MKKEINLAIVDDEILFRKSILHILNREKNIKVVFDGDNGHDILDYLETHEQHPNIILMDIRMPILDGVETAKIISDRFPNIKIVILSSINSGRFIESMIRYGASAYLLKNTLPQQVVHTINRVYEDGVYFRPEMMNILFNAKGTRSNSTSHELSDREIEVLQLICKQYNTKEIADKLCISERTVEGHRLNMLEKTGSKNVVGLILWGIKKEILLVE